MNESNLIFDGKTDRKNAIKQQRLYVSKRESNDGSQVAYGVHLPQGRSWKPHSRGQEALFKRAALSWALNVEDQQPQAPKLEELHSGE